MDPVHPTKNTAVLLVDPYNEFLHPTGKLYKSISASMAESNTIKHMQEVVDAARDAKIPIYYGLHQQFKEGFYQGWNHMNRNQVLGKQSHVFEEGSFGAEIYQGMEPQLSNGDVVVSKHWNSSAFQNTDLDYQLRQRDIHNIVLAGLTANTCLESTARYAFELGYHVTLLTDATAGFSVELARAGTELVWKVIVHRTLNTKSWVESIKGSEHHI